MQKLEVYQSTWGMELRNPSLPERSMVNAFPYSPDDLAPILDFAVEMNACMVNVVSGVMPIKPEDAVSDVRRWIGEASDRDMPLLFETHRDGLLNDLFFRLQLMDLVPEMRLCADLSHFVVDREQVQIQINFPQHQEWVEIFKSWWKEGMREWRKRNDDDATLVFLCELGPPPYAITDADQNELSDRWQESLQIRDWVRTIWAELENET